MLEVKIGEIGADGMDVFGPDVAIDVGEYLLLVDVFLLVLEELEGDFHGVVLYE
jgi:hypothetical protein